MQTLSEKDLHEWLYAISPLLAGQLRSTAGRIRPKTNTPVQEGDVK